MDEWWRGSVTYQIYPRSFQDSDGDGIGDLAGIERRLDHVASLGVDAIWLSPVFPSPMEDMGYDVSDYRDIDPMFGTLAEFDRMVEKAHGLGLKVIIDQVLSHTSDQHAWFKQSRSSRDNPRANWYVWADPQADGTPPNNWLSVFGGGGWEWDAVRRQYYLHNFLKSQPDLNFHEPAVQDALVEAMRFWLDRGVDGFRFDTVNYYFHDAKLRSNPVAERAETRPSINPFDMQDHVMSRNQAENIGFLNRIRGLLDEYPGRTTVGEVGEAHSRALDIMAEYTTGNDRLHMAYSFEMLREGYSAGHFRNCVERFFKAAPDGWPCWSFSNHDVIRHVTRWAEFGASPETLGRQAIAMLLSLRGSVCLYQGEELGQTETVLDLDELTDPPGIRFWPDYKGRDGCRTPMTWDGGPNAGFTDGTPWLPVKAEQAARNVAAQAEANTSMLHAYRAMLEWRRARPVLRAGEMRFFETAEPVLAYLRTGKEGAPVGCVFNLSKEAVAVEVAGLVLVEGAPSEAAVLEDGRLTLGPNGAAFLDCPEGEDGVEVRFGG